MRKEDLLAFTGRCWRMGIVLAFVSPCLAATGSPLFQYQTKATVARFDGAQTSLSATTPATGKGDEGLRDATDPVVCATNPMWCPTSPQWCPTNPVYGCVPTHPAYGCTPTDPNYGCFHTDPGGCNTDPVVCETDPRWCDTNPEWCPTQDPVNCHVTSPAYGCIPTDPYYGCIPTDPYWGCTPTDPVFHCTDPAWGCIPTHPYWGCHPPTDPAVCQVEANDLPVGLSLAEAQPNPFNPYTTLSFMLPETSQVKLTVYDLQGRLVKELINGMAQRGTTRLIFDGSELPSGLYVYALETGTRVLQGKMLLVK